MVFKDVFVLGNREANCHGVRGCVCVAIILIHYVCQFVSLWRGFWGVGEGEAGEATGDWGQFVTGVGLPPRFCVQTVFTKHCSRLKGRNDDRIASLSHHTRGGYKNLPLPPTTERTRGYIEEHIFKNFQNFREPRFKMSEPGFWVLSGRVKK